MVISRAQTSKSLTGRKKKKVKSSSVKKNKKK